METRETWKSGMVEGKEREIGDVTQFVLRGFNSPYSSPETEVARLSVTVS
jgi:hypothetical protein